MRWAHQLGLVATILCSIAGSVVGCVISPQPLPPSIDASKITMELTSSQPDGGELDRVIIVGSAGAVTPGGAQLRVNNLDSGDPANALIVEDDGSFSVLTPGSSGDVFRLRAFHHDLWSEPVDIEVPEEDGPVDPLDRPLEECLLLDPPDRLDFGPVDLDTAADGAIEVHNECLVTVRIEDVRIRISEAARTECEESYSTCMSATDDSDTPCVSARADCTRVCDDNHAHCLDSSDDHDMCEADLEECRGNCSDRFEVCMESHCEDLRRECDDTTTSDSSGFSVDHSMFPLDVPVGAMRSIVVTFIPLGRGHVEDDLIIEVSAPEEERRSVLLTGEGRGG